MAGWEQLVLCMGFVHVVLRDVTKHSMIFVGQHPSEILRRLRGEKPQAVRRRSLRAFWRSKTVSRGLLCLNATRE